MAETQLVMIVRVFPRNRMDDDGICMSRSGPLSFLFLSLSFVPFSLPYFARFYRASSNFVVHPFHPAIYCLLCPSSCMSLISTCMSLFFSMPLRKGRG